MDRSFPHRSLIMPYASKKQNAAYYATDGWKKPVKKRGKTTKSTKRKKK